MAATDFYGLEPLIVARLKQKATSLEGRVQSLQSFDQAIEEGRATGPTAYVVYFDYTVADASNKGHGVAIAQRWIIGVATSERSSTRSNEAVRRTLGPVVMDVHLALAAFRPEKQYGSLIHVDPPEEVAYLAGYGVQPLAFSSTFKLPTEDQRLHRVNARFESAEIEAPVVVK